MPTPIQLLFDTAYTCFILPALFSEAECAALLRPEIKAAYKKAIDNYPTYYRNNERLVVDDTELAEKLFEKIKNYLPQELEITSENPSEAGLWQLKGLNERLRYCRYAAQQYFHRHLDGVHYRNADLQSKLTFMIYLNDAEEFEGGRTLFYKDRISAEIWATYTPRRGDLIIFDHNIWHEGELLQSGEKFVLRSDILYERIASPTVPIAIGQEKAQLPYSEGHLGYVWSLLAWDAEHLLSAGRDKSIRLWNAQGQCLQRLEGHENSVLDLVKINTTTLASCSRDRSVKIWKATKGIFRVEKSWQAHDSIVLDVCLLSSNLLATAGGDSEIRIFDWATGHLQQSLIGHSDWVWQLLALEDGGLLSCSEDGSIRCWNWSERRCVGVLDNEQPTHTMAYDAEKKRLFAGDLLGKLSCWDLKKNQLEWRVKAHEGLIRSIVLLPNGLWATAGEDGYLRVWKTGEQQPVYEYQHQNFVQDLCWHRGRLISAAYDGTIVEHSIPLI